MSEDDVVMTELCEEDIELPSDSVDRDLVELLNLHIEGLA